MRHYNIFDIGHNHDYFDQKSNKDICRKVADKCYIPTNKMMLDLIKKHPGRFKISYSISGVAIEQFEEYCPDVLDSFKELFATKQVELLSETYYHSLASMFNAEEFKQQINLHRQTVEHHFGITPQVFRNTELIYSNGIADMVEDMGYKAILTEGVDRILNWRNPNYVYEPKNGRGMKLLLKNYKLSDDIAFRFSQQSWGEWPLDAPKFAQWVHALDGNADTVNLFMDYETFGEHQWEETGIFNFFKALPDNIFKHSKFDFATPSEVIQKYPPVEKINIPDAISWADSERDLSAWLGNPMQDSIINWLYSFDRQIKNIGDENLLHTWRKLQTSDHFYYMCTKFWSDGDVHKYFSVYEAPHNSYVIMNNILTDMEIRLKSMPCLQNQKTKSPQEMSPKKTHTTNPTDIPHPEKEDKTKKDLIKAKIKKVQPPKA